MKKIIHFILTPIITILFIFLKLPQSEKTFSVHDKNLPIENQKPTENKKSPVFNELKQKEDQTDDTTAYIIIGLLVVFSIYDYAVKVISPYAEKQKSLKRRWKILDDEAEEIQIKFEEEYDVDLSFNLMHPRKRYFKKGEDGKRKFKQKFFKVIWTSGTHRINSRLEFEVTQGVSGQAFLDEDCFGYDFEDLRKRNVDLKKLLKLNQEQIRLTEKVAVVASCPIFLVEDESDRRRVKVIGVLNVECRIEGSGDVLIQDTSARESLYENMTKLANFYTRIS